MPNYKYDYLVFIGRFQPYHSGHHHIATEALKIAKRLIFVIGSHDAPRNIQNPLTTDERIDIIKACHDRMTYVDPDRRIFFAPQVDYSYNDDRWIAAIQSAVQAIVAQTYEGRWQTGTMASVGLVGYDKDYSSYYLKKFPMWEQVVIAPINDCNATDLRKQLYNSGTMQRQYVVNDTHRDRIEKTFDSPQIEAVCDEYDFVKKYRQHVDEFEKQHYPVTFVCVDAVVVQAGHILVVQRGAMPGKGMWALPGGFLEQTETFQEGVLRELYEETKIAVPKPVLAGSIVSSKVYDKPKRSVRGRTITQAFLIKLAPTTKLPKIKGSDDAAKARWMPLAEFKMSRSLFFEDHFSIVEDMLGI